MFSKYLMLLFLLVGLLMVFSTCKKETETEVIITVKYGLDTLLAVPIYNAEVIIEKGDISVKGITDLAGQFHYTFDIEAILDVKVTSYDYIPPAEGESTIRLKQGKTLKKTI